jgi:translation initiation factor eIF-2B subunit delta
VTADAIERVVEAVETGKRLAAEHAAETIGDGDVLLTHDYSTTVLDGIRIATEAGASLELYATEARPRLLGRKTARALAGIDGVETTLIVDSAAGHYLDECDRVLVGMDCIVEGTLYNRVGTYPIAATAADAGVPVDVVGSSAKLVAGGFRFTNDFRSATEVTLEPPDGFAVANPAYDATPTRLLRQVITDEGPQSL